MMEYHEAAAVFGCGFFDMEGSDVFYIVCMYCIDLCVWDVCA